jgi:hypothetical protein
MTLIIFIILEHIKSICDASEIPFIETRRELSKPNIQHGSQVKTTCKIPFPIPNIKHGSCKNSKRNGKKRLAMLRTPKKKKRCIRQTKLCWSIKTKCLNSRSLSFLGGYENGESLLFFFNNAFFTVCRKKENEVKVKVKKKQNKRKNNKNAKVKKKQNKIKNNKMPQTIYL